MQSPVFPANETPMLTVAMAVYNAERYMQQAIENVLSQTYSNFELLLIDDGSTDRSREIASNYEESDSRIRCIFKPINEGLSSVRNLSIAEAKGKYLIMVDADDLMEPNTLELAVREAENSNADVVIWDYDSFCGDLPTHRDGKSRLKGIDINKRKTLLTLPAFMPVRLIRTEYARKARLEFPLGLTKQDIPVHWKMVTDENVRIAFIPQKLFHYRQHAATTSNRKGKSLFSLAKVMDIVGENLREDGLYDIYRKEYLRSRLTLLHGMYDFIKPELKKEAMTMIRERFDDDAEDFFNEDANCLSNRSRLFYKMLQGSIYARIRYDLFLGIRAIYRKLK